MKMEDEVPFEIPEEQLKKMKTQEELECGSLKQKVRPFGLVP